MASKDFIHRVPLVQPNRAKQGDPRDITEISRRVTELSEAISADNRPHLSSRFVDREDGATTVGITLTADQLNGVVHGLGRKYRGWTLAGIDTFAMVREATAAEITTYAVDTTVYLPLWTTDTCAVKLTVW